nr:response regulator transcription factor [Hymenobacter pini]
MAQLATTACDVVLLDRHMPGLGGLATVQRLQAEYPVVRILVLSMVDHERSNSQILEAGAAGYALKNASHPELVAAIQAVAAGRRYLSSELGLAMLSKVVNSQEVPFAEMSGGLSAREREVLQLVVEGLTTAQIADKLFTSPAPWRRTGRIVWRKPEPGIRPPSSGRPSVKGG